MAFPKLINPGDQHTFVETDSVRYVYKPLEELYLVLVTNKQSNILQDLETLQSFSRTLSDTLSSLTPQSVSNNAFELLYAFDEIVAYGGYPEVISASGVRAICAMESHEEKIQGEIAKAKEKEAKDDMNRKIRALEIAKREGKDKKNVYAYPETGYGERVTPVVPVVNKYQQKPVYAC